MKKIIVFIIVLLSINSLLAQECKCEKNHCTNDLKPYSLYDLGKGNKIALCGYANEDDTFSGFVLTDCNSKTNFNFWEDTERCSVEQDIDTLVVQEFAFLPIDKDEYQIVVWHIYKYWYNNKELQQQTFLNPNFPKYNQKQIEDIIKQYQNYKNKLDDKSMILVNKLFVCVISGSEEARKLFEEFFTIHNGLDGAFYEEYHLLENLLIEWNLRTNYKQ
ncbi:MAG: hypothetical protein V4666_02870 [Bacteroidota bacterium]